MTKSEFSLSVIKEIVTILDKTPNGYVHYFGPGEYEQNSYIVSTGINTNYTKAPKWYFIDNSVVIRNGENINPSLSDLEIRNIYSLVHKQYTRRIRVAQMKENIYNIMAELAFTFGITKLPSFDELCKKEAWDENKLANEKKDDRIKFLFKSGVKTKS